MDKTLEATLFREDAEAHAKSAESYQSAIHCTRDVPLGEEGLAVLRQSERHHVIQAANARDAAEGFEAAAAGAGAPSRVLQKLFQMFLPRRRC